MSEVSLKTLRELRSRADELLKSVDTDLKSFLHPFDGVTFLRIPDTLKGRHNISVTTTCSCLMALALTNKFGNIYGNGDTDAAEALRLIIDAPWKSSSLAENNAFTTALVIRTLGFFVEADIAGATSLSRQNIKRWSLNADRKRKKLTISKIASLLSSNQQNFTINEYPPTAAVIYWFVDGVSRANIRLPATHWMKFCRWAREEFNRQVSLVVAQNEAMMDPVAMAMSACLCARLETIIETREGSVLRRGADSDRLALLPSKVELEHSIAELFKHQRNGIWPKYFPLFHYKDAGSNFCFTFELLEAVLKEFGRENNELLDAEMFVRGLDDAVTWCERNRLKWAGKTADYRGWNSGGYLETLQKGQPESWATAVVHMFLWELQSVLSERIQKRLLKQYKAFSNVKADRKSLDRLLDIEIARPGRPLGLRGILRKRFVFPYRGQTQQTLRKQKSKAAKSALLFGPPGTSKTRIVGAVAQELDWPLVQINPSHFLQKSLEGIYAQAGDIFDDLMDLAGVVVLFDELDALVQTRNTTVRPDTAAQFLTTFMLPKLADLHDQGRLVFFMATNFQDRFDEAIKRPGRFDLLLCMGPPTLKAKIKHLHTFIGEAKTSPDLKSAGQLISRYVEDTPGTKLRLELYTYSEFESLIKSLNTTGSLLERLRELKTKGFADLVERDSHSIALRVEDLKTSPPPATLNQLKRLNLSGEKPQADQIRERRIIQYLFDRTESRVPPA